MIGHQLAELPPADLDPGRVRPLVEEILARPEYEALRPGPLQRLLEAVGEVLGRILQRLTSAAEQVPVVGAVAIAAVAVVVVVLLVRFARGVRRERRLAATAAPGGRSPAEWETEALAHEQAQRWRAALRCRYRALIAALALRGLLDEMPGRTAREYLRDASAALPAARAELETVTGAFEAAWYGHRAVGEADVAAFAAAAQRVVAAAARPAEAVGA